MHIPPFSYNPSFKRDWVESFLQYQMTPVDQYLVLKKEQKLTGCCQQGSYCLSSSGQIIRLFSTVPSAVFTHANYGGCGSWRKGPQPISSTCHCFSPTPALPFIFSKGRKSILLCIKIWIFHAHINVVSKVQFKKYKGCVHSAIQISIFLHSIFISLGTFSKQEPSLVT